MRLSQNYFMKTSFIPICFVFSLMLLFISCKQELECHNLNSTFDKYQPDDYEYQQELGRIVKSDSNSTLKYYFENYLEKEGFEYMKVSVRSNSLCASVIIKVNNWDSVVINLKENRGKGYNGAELKKLQLKVIDDSKTVEFLYKGLEEIVD
jgi:hypothetical protein